MVSHEMLFKKTNKTMKRYKQPTLLMLFFFLWFIVNVLLYEAHCHQADILTEHKTMEAAAMISDALDNLHKNSLTQNESVTILKQPQQQQQEQQPPDRTLTDFANIELQESILEGTARRQLLKHRQKRYLVFPEGSSFQLVFDLIIPIVDYTNYAIMGITCAVAWELPSKPPSEIIEHVRTRLHDGTLGVVRRNDTQNEVEYVDNTAITTTTRTYMKDAYYRQPPTPPPPPPPPPPPIPIQAGHSYYYTEAQAPAQAQALLSTNWYAVGSKQQTKPTYYNGDASTSGYANVPTQQLQQQPEQQQQQRPWQPWQQSHSTNWYTKQSASSSNSNNVDANYRHLPDGDNNWWQRNKARIEQNWHDKQQKWRKYETQRNQPQYSNEAIYAYKPPAYTRTGRQRKLLQQPPKHRIHAVFLRRRRRGRRDLDDDSTALERIHLREHLTTREMLFRKIEKLYRTRSLNGTACVLRALCESGQRSYNDEPQSFVMELVGAIFQLPKDDDHLMEAERHISWQYREAYGTPGNCGVLFRECAQDFWQQ